MGHGFPWVLVPIVWPWIQLCRLLEWLGAL